ncbi:AAA family ATPase [Saprospiraceae bacterium]|nr:AAA family ATPase [Saprospiraceae bacterium]
MAQLDKVQEHKPFKFRELKVYSSTEWLAGNNKKYRQVFDAKNTGYIYAELSFFNKYYDEKVWQVEVELRCFELGKKEKSLCKLNFKRKVSKFDNVVYFREGWGNKKKGVFWKRGTYYWEAYINNELVGTKYFYVIDSLQAEEENLLELKSLQLYEGQYDDVIEEERQYMKAFNSEESRYVYLELAFKNLFPKEPWQTEIFAKFYNENRELKGQVNRLRKIKKGEETLVISAGWGSNVKGSWKPGMYYIDVMFLDRLLATVPFELGPEDEEGLPSPILPETFPGIVISPLEETDNNTFEEIMEKLDRLIGLDHIKTQVRNHAKYIQFLGLRKEKGYKEEDSINVHSVFSGNPGTGKTTVARLLGALYKKMGLLTKGHVHEVDRADLVGEYIGQTAPKVKEQIEKARGGVLFIDEAYALARSNDDSKDFGREVIEILVKEMSNGPGDLAVIVAGYPKEVKHFVDSNPGLKSRFKHFFEFSDYLPQELSKIAAFASIEKEVELTKDAIVHIDHLIVNAFRNRDVSFGNARFIHDLIDKAKVNMGLRIMNTSNPELLSREEIGNIILEDVQKINLNKKKPVPEIPIDEELLKLSIAELDGLIGIKNVKQQIHELVSIVSFHKKNGKNVLNNYFLHTVLVGNPGTGKTTVARILTKIYKALGILERGHMVETDRQGLVAGFVGQTAIKTAERIDEASGGVLFIDEAYALSNFNGLQGDYGNEAIQTILKRMEDQRGEFFVFAAGYPDNMDKFLKANPGLNSRFDKRLIFNDYNPAELFDIAIKMLSEQGYKVNKGAIDKLKQTLIKLHQQRDKYFGNARAVRNIILDLIKYQNLRLAKAQSKRANYSISVDDLQILMTELDADKGLKKSTIGFNK